MSVDIILLTVKNTFFSDSNMSSTGICQGFTLIVLYLSITYVLGRIATVLKNDGLTSKVLINDNKEVSFHPLALTGRGKERHKRNVGCPDVECRSLCPWTWVQDSQDGRDPHSIYKAQCMNQTCSFDFDRRHVGNRAKRSLQILTECELIYTEIEVWQDGEATWIPWPIACACSKARSGTLLRTGHGIVMSDMNRMASAGILIFNPSLVEHDMLCLNKQCRSRSVGFFRSQLIWICTVCH